MNILVVDRNEIFPDLLKKVLVEDKKWNIITCSSGLVTLKLIQKFTPDMLIMDLNLPDIDSFEMLSKLKSFSREIYTLVLIDKLEYGKLEQALLVGIDDYVVKPIEQKEMIARIKKAIWSSSRRSAPGMDREAGIPKPWALDEELPGVNHIIIYPNTASKIQETRGEAAATGLENAGGTDFLKTARAAAAEINPDAAGHVQKDNPPVKSASTYTFGLVKPVGLSGADAGQTAVCDPPPEIAGLTRSAITNAPVETDSFSGPGSRGEAAPAEAEPKSCGRNLAEEEKADPPGYLEWPGEDEFNTRLNTGGGTGGAAAGTENAGGIPFRKEAAFFSAGAAPAASRDREGGAAPERDPSYFFGKPVRMDRAGEPAEPGPDRLEPPDALKVEADLLQPGESSAQEKPKPWRSAGSVTGEAGAGKQSAGPLSAGKESGAYTAEDKPGEERSSDRGFAAEGLATYSFGLKQAGKSSQAEDWPAVSKSRAYARPPLGGKEKKKKQPAVVRILGNIFFAGLMVMMVTLAFFLVQSRMAGGPPSVFGHQLYVVLSGSMNPAFSTGSLAFVCPIEPENVKVGDIITFKSSPVGKTLTTHRVVEIDGEDGLSFVTRGDANRVNDPNPVPAENVIGKVNGAIPYLGYLLDFAKTRNGLLFLVVVPGLLVIAFELRSLFRYAVENQKQKELQKGGGLYAGRVVDQQ